MRADIEKRAARLLEHDVYAVGLLWIHVPGRLAGLAPQISHM
jgi:hypothetical protein